ncbi:MAG: rod shape-determining protein MreC [Marinilabiliales bacterium]|nr:MAG: rod shape-determining protein MreC [Marinilabiliales bacterium]
MRNLIRFILNNHFALLFILLEATALVLVFQNNNYQNTVAFNVSRNISGFINTRIHTLTQYLSLQEANQALHEENRMLRNELLSSYRIATPLPEEAGPTGEWERRYNYIPANVIANSVNKQYNYISLDRGALHGIEPEMAVISGSGVAGIVTGVSDNFSTVLPLLNSDLRISSKLKNTGYFGSLFWDGTDPEKATLTDIPHHVILNRGDSVVTSGFSAIFPEGIMVGTITDFEIYGGNFWAVTVRLSTDFRKLNHVYVIQDLLREELLELEEASEYD